MNKRFMESRSYQYNARLGKGAFGKVVKAYSTLMKKMVAIKVIDVKKRTDYIEKFLPREKDIMETLDHPNIVRTHEIFESGKGTVYMVMELCVKGDLLNYINCKRALSELSSCRLFTHRRLYKHTLSSHQAGKEASKLLGALPRVEQSPIIKGPPEMTPDGSQRFLPFANKHQSKQ